MIKFVTWNVNGLRASLNSVFDYLADYKPDFLALQETRVTEPVKELENLGYDIQWNIGERDGYSGTAIMYRSNHKPLSIQRDFGIKIFDIESRLIALDYSDYIVINVYVPNPQEAGSNRWHYRIEWDAAFHNFVSDLIRQGRKLIICGDFNVAHENIDVYSKKQKHQKKSSGFVSTEQDGLDALLNLGLTDVYRTFHPDRKDAYTCWSNRHNMRSTGRGWRLDYFLISKKLLPRVLRCEIQSEIQGSDHAPVVLYIRELKPDPLPVEDVTLEPIFDLLPEEDDEDETPEPIPAPLPVEDTTPEPTSDPLPEENTTPEPIPAPLPEEDETPEPIPEPIYDTLPVEDTVQTPPPKPNVVTIIDDEHGQKWNKVNWQKTTQKVLDLQKDIAILAQKYNKYAKEISDAQNRLTLSLEARLLAVRRATDNASSAGTDKVLWRTPSEKMQAALSLTPVNYMAKPVRRIILNIDGKDRHIQIPTMYDRAMQVLYSFALDPVVETWADRTSFGFRTKRSAYDHHAHIVHVLAEKDPPMWVLKADVRKHYDNISHQWLLNNAPMNRYVLKQFINARIVFDGELFPPQDNGISVGAPISSILANLTLDGAQKEIYRGLHGRCFGIDYSDGKLIRFADDILVTARTFQSADNAYKTLEAFVAKRGLHFAPEKTSIINLKQHGFDLLARHYQYINGILRTTPSEAAIAKLEEELREIIGKYHRGQKVLIEKINAKLQGWASYHKITDATQAFAYIDTFVTSLLLDWCEKRHPHIPMQRIMSRFFYKEYDGIPVFVLEHKPGIRILRLTDIILVNHKPVSITKNPYIDHDYYTSRTDEKAILSVTGRYKAIWQRQGGKCYYCGVSILRDEIKCVVQIDQTQPKSLKNTAYIHEYCSHGQAEFYESDDRDILTTRINLYQFLENMANQLSAPSARRRKYLPLAEYFKTQTKATITLKFKTIEEILGKRLCPSAYRYQRFWYHTNITANWRSNGYRMRSVDVEKQSIVLEQVEKLGVSVHIPDVILHGHVPTAAATVIETMFERILDIYGLSHRKSGPRKQRIKTDEEDTATAIPPKKPRKKRGETPKS